MGTMPPAPDRAEVTQQIRVALPRRPSVVPFAAAIVAVGAAFLGGVWLGEHRARQAMSPELAEDGSGPETEAEAARAAAPVLETLAAEDAAQTGFDLRVEPAGVEVRLDGRAIGHAPLRVRNLAAGEHRIDLAPPPGYLARHMVVVVEAGVARTYEMALDRAE
jgi:hypothetical protein